ncbi:hypothetical protein V2H45_02675 [Tumidithrix elongata RA019]|uniref:Transmembrane protein n=1 Tax=Tumidithrix elongata BACA0141 TaxID=2716417 RepID=A0AAW9PWK6_9CYAN|nr:hypothetical protein [Tumidithrix elongata RA019]
MLVLVAIVVTGLVVSKVFNPSRGSRWGVLAAVLATLLLTGALGSLSYIFCVGKECANNAVRMPIYGALLAGIPGALWGQEVWADENPTPRRSQVIVGIILATLSILLFFYVVIQNYEK